MSQKKYNIISGSIFVAVSAVHLIRSVAGWPLYIGPVSITVGVSVVAFLVAGYLAYSAFKLNK